MCAWKAQHKFLEEKFLPMVNRLNTTLHLDNHYAGQVFGNLQKGTWLMLHKKPLAKKCIPSDTVAEFKEFASMGIKNTSYLKRLIGKGLSINSATSEPQYVSFFVPRKFKTNEKKDTKHMCVFTVRSYEGQKDGIKLFSFYFTFFFF